MLNLVSIHAPTDETIEGSGGSGKERRRGGVALAKYYVRLEGEKVHGDREMVLWVKAGCRSGEEGSGKKAEGGESERMKLGKSKACRPAGAL